MFNIYKLFLALLGFFVTFGVYAQDGGIYSFLNIPSSYRIYGLGGVNISTVDGGIESTEQNPALLGPEYQKRFGIGYMRYFNDSNFGSIIYGSGIKEHNAWSLGLRYIGYGNIQRTDISGNVLEDFSPVDLVLSLSYSHDINYRLRGGISLKSIYSSYDNYNAFALAVDLGVNYYVAEKDLSLSAVIVNLGGQIKRFDQAYERLPIDIRFGWTQSFPGLPVRFSITAWNLTRWNIPYTTTSENTADSYRNSFTTNLFRHLVFGADIIPSQYFHLCLGYNYKVRTDMSSAYRNLLSGFYLGLGLDVSGWGVGISYSQVFKGANTFMLNISTSFDNFFKKS